MMEATTREKGLVFAVVAGFISWKDAYLYSRNREIKDTRPEEIDPATVTRWKQGKKIQNAIHAAEIALQDRDNQTAEQARRKMEEERRPADSESPESKQGRQSVKNIDYTDPEARKRLYNEIILASSDDPKTQLDAAKVIEQTQRDDKQAARERKTVVFFTPVKCLDCQMYQKAKARHEKG